MKEFLDSLVDGDNIAIGSITLSKHDGTVYLRENGEQWMVYNSRNLYSLQEFHACYDLAYGTCILSGLGMGLLPELLLNKSEVTSIIVIEANIDVINLHKQYNKRVNDFTIIHSDMRSIKDMQCDCLLLDHYELESNLDIFQDTISIVKNVKCNLMWYWSIERFLYINHKTSELLNNANYYSEYLRLFEYYDYQVLPHIDEETLLTYLQSALAQIKDQAFVLYYIDEHRNLSFRFANLSQIDLSTLKFLGVDIFGVKKFISYADAEILPFISIQIQHLITT
jgi:cell fate (sporulation/competence/biofilm development) regulator YmcA (YheA/YmcA/DUF963 family)